MQDGSSAINISFTQLRDLIWPKFMASFISFCCYYLFCCYEVSRIAKKNVNTKHEAICGPQRAMRPVGSSRKDMVASGRSNISVSREQDIVPSKLGPLFTI